MAPEKSLKDAGNQKQKVMIAIVIIVVLIVIWQVMGMKGGGSAPAPSITATPGGGNNANNNAMKPPGGTSGMAAAGGGAMGQMGASSAPIMSQTELNQPRPAPVQSNTEILKLQQQTQADYIASINKLQMLKIQREIDETKTAIATAELNRMTAEKSIADLITSKENMSANIDMPPAVNPSSSSVVVPVVAPLPVMPQQPQLIPYTVSSVSFEGRKWTAILTTGGKSMTVVVGDTLDDGSIVTGITRNTVTLKRDTKVRTLTIQSSI